MNTLQHSGKRNLHLHGKLLIKERLLHSIQKILDHQTYDIGAHGAPTEEQRTKEIKEMEAIFQKPQNQRINQKTDLKSGSCDIMTVKILSDVDRRHLLVFYGADARAELVEPGGPHRLLLSNSLIPPIRFASKAES